MRLGNTGAAWAVGRCACTRGPAIGGRSLRATVAPPLSAHASFVRRMWRDGKEKPALRAPREATAADGDTTERYDWHDGVAPAVEGL